MNDFLIFVFLFFNLFFIAMMIFVVFKCLSNHHTLLQYKFFCYSNDVFGNFFFITALARNTITIRRILFHFCLKIYFLCSASISLNYSKKTKREQKRETLEQQICQHPIRYGNEYAKKYIFFLFRFSS